MMKRYKDGKARYNLTPAAILAHNMP